MANRIELTNLSLIWDNLGTFWGQFPDKELFTEIWEAYSDVATEIFRRKAQANLSKNLLTLIPVLEFNYESYPLVFTGVNKNTITISGLDAYELPNYTCNIPALSGIETEQDFTTYQISEYHYLQFTANPDFNPDNVSIFNGVTLYAEKVYRHNPVLWDVHADSIDLDISSLDNEDYLPYNTIESSGIERTKGIALHYKYLIWALSEMKRRVPNITNIKTAFGISRGAAFAYRAGTVESIDGQTMVVRVDADTTDTYTIPAGFTYVQSVTDAVGQFDLLMDGINLYDVVNNSAYILALPEVNTYNYTSTIAFTYSADFDTLNYNQTYHDAYLASLIPAGLSYQSAVE